MVFEFSLIPLQYHSGDQCKTWQISLIWLGVLLLGVIDAIWLAITPLSLSDASWRSLVALLPFIALGMWGTYRFPEKSRLQVLSAGWVFLMIAWLALRVYNHLTMTIRMPLADQYLASVDQNLGFDWKGYVLLLDSNPIILKLMDYSYAGLSFYSAIIFSVLLIDRDFFERCTELIGIFLISAIACMTIGMMFPAAAAATFYEMPLDTLKNVPVNVGAYHIDLLNELRSNPDHILAFSSLPGLVTFPSFHTAMGVVAIYCTRGTLWMLVPSVMINGLMIASTPLFGSHYLIDIIAGVVVAVGSIMTFRAFARKPADKTLFLALEHR